MNFKTRNQAIGTGIAIGVALGVALMGLTNFGAGGLAIGLGLGVALGSIWGKGLPDK